MGSLLSKSKSTTDTRREKDLNIHRTPDTNFDTITIPPAPVRKNSRGANVEPISAEIPPDEKPSAFYLACRNNQIDEVRRLLPYMSLDDINRIEPNGSTALHAASYFGHGEIVALLLEAGADRSISNRFGCKPFDEGKNDRIKNLFYRTPTANRYVNSMGAIEWVLFSDDVEEKAMENRDILQTLYNRTPVVKMLEKIQKNYLEKTLQNVKGVEIISRFFHKAVAEANPAWIINAYTAETDFYKILNAQIAGGAAENDSERRYMIALLYFHPSLDQFAYIGTSYRAVECYESHIAQYRINALLMTKAFVSSSISESVVELSICQKEVAKQENTPSRWDQEGQKIQKILVMFVYHIKQRRTALHIENISQYPAEGEVLIMPYSVFKVLKISQTRVSQHPYEYVVRKIELEEVLIQS